MREALGVNTVVCHPERSQGSLHRIKTFQLQSEIAHPLRGIRDDTRQ
jgi:hypothetical protein